MAQRFVGTPFVSVAFLVLITLALATSAVSTERDAFVHPHLIVSVSWLMQHTTDPHLRLVDARPTTEYDKGHIPGAVSLPVADTFDPAQHKNYPDTKEKLEALFARRGLSNTTRIITYDNGKEHLRVSPKSLLCRHSIAEWGINLGGLKSLEHEMQGTDPQHRFA